MFASTLALALSQANPAQAAPPALPAVSADLHYAEEQAVPPPVPSASAPDISPSVPAAPGQPAAPTADAAPPPDIPPHSAKAPAASGQQIVVTGENEKPASDPAEAVNEASYQVVQKVDGAIVAPLAMAYKHVLPSPVRSGLRNFLINLTEPVVFVNFLLQGKPGKAAETLGRFAVNSTVGVGGLVDVARNKPFRLPHRNNGFANTMGFYGIGPGPYLFLPLVGPTTLRDVIGLGLDRAFLPAIVGKPLSDPYYAIGSGTIKSLDDRVQLDCELTAQAQTSNPYNTAREYYLERRKSDIEALHGRTYVPQGHSLTEIIQQCSADQQRATTPVAIPQDEISDSPAPGAPLVIPVPAPPAPAPEATPTEPGPAAAQP